MLRVVRGVPALLLLALGAPALAGPDCGRLPTGENPAVPEMAQAIAEASARHGVPTEVIKAIAWQESGCQQWRSDGSFVINPKDCGYGLMQLTGATAEQFDIDRLKDDWRYNLDAGVTVLRQKWARAVRQGLVPDDPEARRVLENWYHPIAFYYGARDEAYLRKIYGHLVRRPGRLQQLLNRAVEITLPSDAIPGFRFGQRFLAHAEGVFVDAAGEAHRAVVHLGTIGDERTLAELDVRLARGRKYAERGDARRAVRYLAPVLEADLDTTHKAEAAELLAPFLEEAEAQLARAAELYAEGEAREARKVLRRVARELRGHPIGERAEELEDDYRS